MKLKSINPYNNQLLAEFEEYTDKIINDKLAQASETFKNWRKTDFAERAEKMTRVAEILEAEKKELAKTITLEMGKPIKESLAEIEKCAWVCRYYAENAEEFLKDRVIKTDAQQSYVIHEPLGVILAIMPWNFPFWQVFRFAAPALMAGNIALLKHASNVQGCARHIEDIFKNAGFPEGTFQNLVIGSDKVENVIENDIVKAITLTGSELAGSKVAELAGKNIKKTVLELGGSNAFIVFEDANLEKAAKTAVIARFMNGGQSCIAAKRFIIHKTIANDFLNLFIENVKGLYVGDPLNEKTDIGPLANLKQAEITKSQVDRSVEKGAKVILGGDHKNALFYPTIIKNIDIDMPVFNEEVFGPVAPIMVFKNEREAIDLANKTDYGLGLSIFTENISRAKSIVSEFEDGAVFINSLVKSDPRLPFGGTKKSGYGRELSSYGIHEFVNAKTVFID